MRFNAEAARQCSFYDHDSRLERKVYYQIEQTAKTKQYHDYEFNLNYWRPYGGNT